MKLWTLAFATIALARGSTLPRDAAPEPLLQKPLGDFRDYQHAVLRNGLRVVNIRDPNSTQAAVALAVTVGSFSDPEGFEGLAHLLEHAMFLGSKSYPESSGFDAWLAAHGGSSNAYTGEEQTVFYAEVNRKVLRPCLWRYSDIFLEPLFKAEWIWDEVNAVDSEHNKNRKSQDWRVSSLINHAAEGPMSRFHTGNAKTLRRKGQAALAAEIRRFFAAHYCPLRMRLVTFGAQPLSEQLAWARGSFGRLPRGTCRAAESFAGRGAFGSLGRLLRMQGLSPTPELHLVFPMENLQPWVRSNPLAYLQHLLGYAGDESLLLALRDELELASSVAVAQEDSSAGSKVIVSMSLLPEGFQRLPLLLEAFFAFMERARLRPKAETTSVLQSLRRSAQLGYDWSALQAASSAAAGMADDMTKWSPSELMVAGRLILEASASHVEALLERLRPERMLLVLVDPMASSYWAPGPKDAHVLPHYDVRYIERPLDAAWPAFRSKAHPVSMDQRLAEVSKSLQVPGRIEGLVSLSRGSPPLFGAGRSGQLWGAAPEQLFGDLWHRERWVLRQPRVTAMLILRNRQEKEVAVASRVVAFELGLRMRNELLSERLGALKELGTAWRLERGHSSLSIYMSSFSTHAREHFAKVLAELNRPEAEALAGKRLRRLREELRMEYSDQSEPLLSYAVRQRGLLLLPQAYSQEELLGALGGTAAEAVRRPVAVTQLVMGTETKEQAVELLTQNLRHLEVKEEELIPACESERVDRVLRYERPMELRAPNPRGDGSHGLLLTLLLGAVPLRRKLLLSLVAELLQQVAFAYLRTQLQLGYVVGGSVAQISNVLTISCFVQSEVADPDVAEQRCEEVLNMQVPMALKRMSPEDFGSVKESFRLQLLHAPLSTNEELDRFWEPIRLGGCFNASEEMLSYLEHVKKEEVMAAWLKAVTPKAREKVLVKLFGAVNGSAQAVELPPELAQGLRHERHRTRVLRGAHSAAKRLEEPAAGYYPQRLSCDVSDEAPEAAVKPSFLRRE